MRITYKNPRTDYFKGTIIHFIKEFKKFKEVIKKKLHEIKEKELKNKLPSDVQEKKKKNLKAD